MAYIKHVNREARFRSLLVEKLLAFGLACSGRLEELKSQEVSQTRPNDLDLCRKLHAGCSRSLCVSGGWLSADPQGHDSQSQVDDHSPLTTKLPG